MDLNNLKNAVSSMMGGNNASDDTNTQGNVAPAGDTVSQESNNSANGGLDAISDHVNDNLEAVTSAVKSIDDMTGGMATKVVGDVSKLGEKAEEVVKAAIPDQLEGMAGNVLNSVMPKSKPDQTTTNTNA